MSKNLIQVGFGAGTNSTAMLIGMYDRGIRPDFILFSDTGGERPKTYEHVEEVNEWLESIGWPLIVTVKANNRAGEIITLEQDCLRRGALPSLAYGFKTCSQRLKIAPQDKYMNNNAKAKAHWKAGGKITKYIGYDAGEPQRAKDYTTEKYDVEYPLIEWDWCREECIEAIDNAGLKRPGKSACFFCPSAKQADIKMLNATNPDLMARAIAMEDNADLTKIKGLGRRFAWKDVINTDDMFAESYIDMDCGCYDG